MSDYRQRLDSPAGAEAKRIIERLRSEGFVAYLAGGCVRDALLGRDPKDFDVATSATPDAIRAVFGMRRTLAFGASFGVIGVLPDRAGHGASLPVTPTEVATFRSDGTYRDGRRPDSVHFGTAAEDALRRDFTINGLFYDPIEHRVIDYIGGQADLDAGIIRTIGSAHDRFSEDKLRMLRAVRFATTLKMRMEPTTLAAIISHAEEIHVVSGERVGAEMRRILVDTSAANGMEVLQGTTLARQILPELAEMQLAVWRCDLVGLDRVGADASSKDRWCAALALLLSTHPQPEQALHQITARWKLANDERDPITFAMDSMEQLICADHLAWSNLQPQLINRDRKLAVLVAHARAVATGRSEAGIKRCQTAIALPDEVLNPAPLVTGDDLRQLAIPMGPLYRDLLSVARNAQLDGEIRTRDEAIALVKSRL